MAREGIELAPRIGSRIYAFTMYGNAAVCAVRVGDWTWARTQLDEAVAADIRHPGMAELHGDLAILQAITGGDPSAALAEAARLRVEITDPQYESYGRWADAWAALATGRYSDAKAAADDAVRITNYFRPLAWPLAGRAMAWAEDLDGVREMLAAIDGATLRGAAIELDRATLAASVAGLEGRSAEALLGLRDAIAGYTHNGLAFDAALATIDLASVLGEADCAAPEVVALVETARATLIRLGARPFLDRLETVLARGSAASSSQRQTEGAAAASPAGRA